MDAERDVDRPLRGTLVRLGFSPERIVLQAGARGVAIARRGAARELVTIVDGAVDDGALRERSRWDRPLRSAELVTTGAGQQTIIAEELEVGEPSTLLDMRARRPGCAAALVEAVWTAHAEGEVMGAIVPELVFVDPSAYELVGVAQRPLRAEAAAIPKHGEPPLYGVAAMTPAGIHGRPDGPPEDVFRIATILWRWRHGADPLGGSSSFDRMAILSGGMPGYETSAASPAVRAGVGDRLDALLVEAMALDPLVRPTANDLLWVVADLATW